MRSILAALSYDGLGTYSSIKHVTTTYADLQMHFEQWVGEDNITNNPETNNRVDFYVREQSDIFHSAVALCLLKPVNGSLPKMAWLTILADGSAVTYGLDPNGLDAQKFELLKFVFSKYMEGML